MIISNHIREIGWSSIFNNTLVEYPVLLKSDLDCCWFAYFQFMSYFPTEVFQELSLVI